jgi:hypothetical protein
MHKVKLCGFIFAIILVSVAGLNAEEVHSSKFIEKSYGTRKIIIFIHGFMGNTQTTWTYNSPTVNSYWPTLIEKDDDLKDFDTFVVGYKTENLSIDEITSDVLESLENAKIFENYDDIYVIAHSMGGLIFKQLIWNMATNKYEKRDLKKFKAVLFLSTPTLGTAMPDALKNLFNLIGLSLNVKPASELLPSVDCPCSSLETFETNWIKYRKNFAPTINGEMLPRSFCAVESQDTDFFKIVNFLTTLTQTDAPIKIIDANHIDIAKPENIQSEVFVWAKTCILSTDKLIHPN